MPLILHSSPTKRGALPSAQSWQLADGHYIAAKMAPVIIGPSAATEAGTDAAWSRYRRCPSGIAYRIPISVLGGAWPFKYEIVSGPSGMTIGEVYGDTDYGILSWSNPTTTGSPHTVSVKITDQDGTIATREWDLQVIDRENTTYFVFLDASGGSNGNDGSYSSPKQTLLGWYGSDTNDSTHSAKQAFYFSGTYHNNVVTDPSGFKVWLRYKPHVHVAIPGETAVIDNDLALYWSGMRDDFAACGLQWANGWCLEGSVTSALHGRMTYIRQDQGYAKRQLVFENYFGPVSGGYVAQSGSNPATIFLDAKDQGAIYFVASHNTHEHNSGEFLESYGAHDLVFQHNTLVETSGDTEICYLKSSGNQRWSIRANTGAGRKWITNVSDGIQSEADHATHDIETCWNSFRSTTGAPARHQESSGAAVGNIWWFRNSLTGTADIQHNTGSSRYSDPVAIWEKNVLEGCDLLTDTSGDSICNFSNDSSATTNVTGYLDGSNLLTGSGLAYLGTHGAEVA